MVLVELLKGTGFPTEANAGRGLRWRIRMKDLHGRVCGDKSHSARLARLQDLDRR